MEQKQRSPWFYVGIGCLALLVAALGAVAALGTLGYRKVREMEAQMKDPVARSREARRLLGAEDLPEGYHPMAAFRIPLVMEMAMLSDAAPEPDGQPGKHPRNLFVYVNAFTAGADQQNLRDYLEGKRDDAEVLHRSGVDLERREVLRRGTLARADGRLRYVVQRGDVVMQGKRRPGLTTLGVFECGDTRLRMGIWTGPDPGNDALAGSLADEAVIGPFFAHFKPCGS